MDYNQQIIPATVLHWNYRGFTEFPIQQLRGEETDITDIYLKENLISRLPNDIGRLENLESLYLSGNDIIELPREISMLRSLKCLDVSGNRLKYIPDEIGEVRALKFLILDENELSELPLRLSELRELRYLSKSELMLNSTDLQNSHDAAPVSCSDRKVWEDELCTDNKLKWLPQRPVYNYHHCEFRFWRNTDLRTIPYSLWYHMLREQQTRSINIGCLQVSKYHHTPRLSRCRLKLKQDTREWDVDVDCPPQYHNVVEKGNNTPPSLCELSKRKIYRMISDAAKKLNDVDTIYSSHVHNQDNDVHDISENLDDININNGSGAIKFDVNGNNYLLKLIPSVNKRDNGINDNKRKTERKRYYVPADVINDHLFFLPNIIKKILINGPVSQCENINCKKLIFDYVHYEFCFGKIILIDNIEEIILNATFCSKVCADVWRKGNMNTIPWTLAKYEHTMDTGKI